MALSLDQQIFEKLKGSRNILLALPRDLNADVLGGALALADFFKSQNKNPEIICARAVPELYSFLPDTDKIKNNFEAIRDFIISVDTSEHKISQLKYEQEKNLLKIFLTSPHKIEEKNVHLEPGTFKYDLIITLGCQDLESLGELFERQSELFFEKPILNIDNRSANENFGEINLVEPTATSCCEIILNLFEKQKITLTKKETATWLLAGIIEKTESFQNAKTSPRALSLASLLINAGAERETIITHLYKTKPLPMLKLWGKILAKINYLPEQKLVFGFVPQEDFENTGTTSQILPLVLKEIKETFAGLNAAYLLWQGKEDQLKGIFYSPKDSVCLKLEEFLNTKKQEDYIIFSPNTLKTEEALEQINSLLAPLL